MINEWYSAQVGDKAANRQRDFGGRGRGRDYISVSYDKEPEQDAVNLDDVFNNAPTTYLDDVFNNAPTTLKQTKRGNILLKQLGKQARGNQWLKAKKGQGKPRENKGAFFDGYSEIKLTEVSPIPHIDDLFEGYQDAF